LASPEDVKTIARLAKTGKVEFRKIILRKQKDAK
jgi:hypothetical protein